MALPHELRPTETGVEPGSRDAEAAAVSRIPPDTEARAYEVPLRGLEHTLAPLIDGLDLSDLQRRSLRARWLDQVVWMDAAATRAHRWYHGLRLITVVGAVLIPALISLDLGNGHGWLLRGGTFALSLVVAICAAVEEFFHFGERWRHYRQFSEELKIEGWKFLQLTGPYRRFSPSHSAGYPRFAARVEAIIERDVEVYITDVVREEDDGEKKKDDS
jgi:hypothetical protein